MSSVQVQSKIEMESLLEGIAQLDTPALVQFQERVTRLLAQRKMPPLSSAETTLLLKINEGFAPEFFVRYNELSEKLQNEVISLEEQQELLQLTHLIEAKNVERLQYLIELSRVRGISLDALMEQLGLQKG